MFHSPKLNAVMAELSPREGGVSKQLSYMDKFISELEEAQSHVIERYSRVAIEHPVATAGSDKQNESQSSLTNTLSHMNGRLEQMIRQMHAFAEHCDL